MKKNVDPELSKLRRQINHLNDLLRTAESDWKKAQIMGPRDPNYSPRQIKCHQITKQYLKKMDELSKLEVSTNKAIAIAERDLADTQLVIENENRNSSIRHYIPRMGEYLLYLFVARDYRDILLGDLEEDFKKIHAKFGLSKAKFWYYKQVTTSLYPLIQALIRKVLKWGIIGWVGELIRRLSS